MNLIRIKPTSVHTFLAGSSEPVFLHPRMPLLLATCGRLYFNAYDHKR